MAQEHVEVRQGCYTLTGRSFGLMVEARCECGETDAFYLHEDWQSGDVARAHKTCPHSRLGKVKGCMKVVAIVGADTLQLECLRCRERVFVSVSAWDFGSWDATHDCSHWRDAGT